MKKIIRNFCILICIHIFFLTFCSEDIQKLRLEKSLKANIEKIKNDLEEATEMIEKTYELLQLLEIEVKDMKQITDQITQQKINEKDLNK